MYLRRIEIENNGPIKYLNYSPPFDIEDRPKPVVFVGRNGSGKSILLSHIVNAMISAKSAVYTDSDMEENKVFKYRSPGYIMHGENYYRSHIQFDNGFYQGEIQADMNRREFEESRQFTPIDKKWNEIEMDSSSSIWGNFSQNNQSLKDDISKSTLLYFPANRFEEPSWLNIDNLKNNVTYSAQPKIAGVSGRQIINASPLHVNQNWLLDVIYESLVVDRRIENINFGIQNVPVVKNIEGPSTKIRIEIENFFKILLGVDGHIQWSIGRRGNRSISVATKSKPISANLFSLSTGQTSLLNIFLTLIRDFDTSDATFSRLDEIRGIVVIDEVDLHLHTEMQYIILPRLIALFPRVQFVITSHSPLFILGLEKHLGQDGFALVDLPSGDTIGVERFSEFEAAYQHFKESTRFASDIQKSIEDSQMPIIFMEGSIDVDYILRAADILGRQNSIKKLKLLDANGYGNLDKIWKYFDENISNLSNRRIILIYDCDVKKINFKEKKPGICRIIMPKQSSLISKGIENLFPDACIRRAMQENPLFVDITLEVRKIIRGIEVTEPERWEINRDEKRNIADWIIANGSVDDFVKFNDVFDLIEKEILYNETT